MAKATYNLIVGLKIPESEKKEIENQINKIGKSLKPIDLPINAGDVKQAAGEVDKLSKSAEDLNLNFNSANEVLSKTVQIISSLVGQVSELDAALTEYKKVSDLSGRSLDDYVDKLSNIGREVGRTGKPNRSEPGQWDGKPVPRTAPKPLKASRALQLQYRMR